MKMRRVVGIMLAAGALVTVAGCGGGGGNTLEKQGGSSSGSTDKGAVTVGGQDFTESQIMAAIYGQILTNAGFTVTTKLVTTRDVYIGQLSSGGVDIVPDYLAGITDFLNTLENGANAKLVSSHDPQATLKALKPLAAAKNISILPPSDATNQNAFIVTKAFADQNNLKTLSDLAALGQPIKLAAPPDCKERSDCRVGLQNVYGINITELVPLDFASAQMKDAVSKGEVQLGETGTTDGTLAAQGLVPLQDDKGIQPAQNLTPAVNSDFLKANPQLAATFDKLSAALTTSDLATMDAKVDVARQKPEDVAKQFLTSKGLI